MVVVVKVMVWTEKGQTRGFSFGFPANSAGSESALQPR